MPFASVLARLTEADSCLLDFRVVLVDFDLLTLQSLRFSLPAAIWSPECLTRIHEVVAQGHELHWFTDGACCHLDSPLTRHSAFAVIWDLCLTDAERTIAAGEFLATGIHPDTLVSVVSARTPGEQDILRAEIHAIYEIIVTIGQGVIHVDSQTALDMVHLALTAASPREFAKKDHMDLLIPIWHRRSRVCITLRKVRARQDLTQITNALERYSALGNWKADKVAGDTVTNHLPDMTLMHDQGHQYLEEQIQDARAVLQLHYNVKELAARQMTTHRTDIAPEHDCRQVWEAFRCWQVPVTTFQTPDADLQYLCHGMFGETNARRTYQWLCQLKWPDADEGPLRKITGISWIELALSWMHMHKAYLPVIRQDNLQTKYVYLIGSDRDAVDHGLSWTECGAMLQRLIENTAALVP